MCGWKVSWRVLGSFTTLIKEVGTAKYNVEYFIQWKKEHNQDTEGLDDILCCINEVYDKITKTAQDNAWVFKDTPVQHDYEKAMNEIYDDIVERLTKRVDGMNDQLTASAYEIANNKINEIKEMLRKVDANNADRK